MQDQMGGQQSGSVQGLPPFLLPQQPLGRHCFLTCTSSCLLFLKRGLTGCRDLAGAKTATGRGQGHTSALRWDAICLTTSSTIPEKLEIWNFRKNLDS